MLKKLLKIKGKIFLIGRGVSNNFYFSNYNLIKKKNDIVIGFNIFNNDKIDIIFTNKKLEYKKKDKAKIVQEIQLKKLISQNFREFKIGTVNYSLHTLFTFLNKFLKKKKKIILIGFDFRSANEDNDFERKIYAENFFQRNINIMAQNDIFFVSKNLYNNLQIKHLGHNFLSDSSLQNYVNSKKKKSNLIKNYKIVAEVTTNHFGYTKNIEYFFKFASLARATHIKFQKRDFENFYTKKQLNKYYNSPFGKTFYDYRKKLELTSEQIKYIKKLGKKFKIIPFFTVLDINSFKFIKKFKFPIIKIPSTISQDRDFIDYISKNYFGEIVVSTGMTDYKYLEYICKKFKNNSKLYVLHCISAYPASVEDLNISIIGKINELKKKYKNVIPGYSSHDLTHEASAMAIAAGAKMLEKHVKLRTYEWSHFDATALDIKDEFPYYVRKLHAAIKINGDGKKKILDIEHHKYFHRKN